MLGLTTNARMDRFVNAVEGTGTERTAVTILQLLQSFVVQIGAHDGVDPVRRLPFIVTHDREHCLMTERVTSALQILLPLHRP